ncbi:MAG TPA: hypothetical protein ENJ11_05285 [Gammaproteobacteria bacterium]|nr:hypothetical protein [Gammaproteobacteria bacterium]
MDKFSLLPWLVTGIFASSSLALAHNADNSANNSIEQHREQRKIAEEQQDQQTWDDFINAVKKQEAEPAAEPAETDAGRHKPEQPSSH